MIQISAVGKLTKGSLSIPPLPVFSKSLPEDQLNITADLNQTF